MDRFAVRSLATICLLAGSSAEKEKSAPDQGGSRGFLGLLAIGFPGLALCIGLMTSFCSPLAVLRTFEA
jgi:hypothetical protein